MRGKHPKKKKSNLSHVEKKMGHQERPRKKKESGTNPEKPKELGEINVGNHNPWGRMKNQLLPWVCKEFTQVKPFSWEKDLSLKLREWKWFKSGMGLPKKLG